MSPSTSPNPHRVTVIGGDGIGPEIMKATRRVLEATGVGFDFEECVAGGEAFRKGIVSGVPADTLDSIARTGVVLKGPLATPIAEGEKSANVTLRQEFGLFGNIRPARSVPEVLTPFSGRKIDLVVVRENVEDLYAGIEHELVPGYAQALKVITPEGSERVIRLAFELAQAEGRSKIHVAHKANILKLTEGNFVRTFDEVAKEYPSINAQRIIIDNFAQQLIINPEQFEVVVMTNLHGDIMSDLAAGLIGGLGLTPSANLGEHTAIFEAVHGTAPDIAGQGKANPSALLLSSEMMLRYFGEIEAAKTLRNAIARTYEDKRVRTGDLRNPSAQIVGTDAFADEIIANLGKLPSPRFQVTDLSALTVPKLPASVTGTQAMRDVGIDLLVAHQGAPMTLVAAIEPALISAGLQLESLSNRGLQLYPGLIPNVPLSGVYTCRVTKPQDGAFTDNDCDAAQAAARQAGLRVVQSTRLIEVDGKRAFTRPQGADK